jgi:hypothetical protein
MGYITALDADFNSEDQTYTIRVTDENENITNLPVENLEEFSEVLSKLGRERLVLTLNNYRFGPAGTRSLPAC